MSTTPDLALAAFKMVASLGVVLAVIWGLYRMAKKNLPMAQAGGKGKMLQVLESHYLGPKKSIAMVQVPGAVLVLGVSPDKVNLLTRLDDPAIISSIAARADDHRPVRSFKEHLQRLTRPRSFDNPANANESTVK